MPATSRHLRRYGPLALIAVVALVIGAVVLVGGGDADETAETDDTASVDDALGLGDGPGAPEPVGEMPPTYAEADDAGTTGDFDWGDRCDPETGKVELPSVYAAPCVPLFEGDNGGATHIGVTDDTIRIVRYVGDQSSDLSALLAGAGASNTPEQQSETYQDYLEVFTAQAELYGRTIELVDYDATGLGNDVVASKADATQIATELEPFLVIGGPGSDRGTFAQELTSHGIVCIDCAGALPPDMLEGMRPNVWATLPAAEQFIATLGAWVEQAPESPEAGNATFAGDPEYHDSPRKVGVIHYDQDPPVFEVAEEDVPEGVAVIDSYVLDFATLPQKAAELVAKFKADDITTVYFLGDPLMPIYLMSAATDQDYNPEWVFSGTVFTDTNLFGRQYDQEQMQHAFGISQLAAPTVQDIQDPIRLYRWYFGDEDALPPAQVQYSLIAAQVRLAVLGIHMAGPELTDETYARGMFRVPPMGGGPTTPQVSFGNWGFFPDTDYNGIDDSAEIWWDPTVAGPDEAGNDGMGAWRRAHGGKRFVNAQDVPTPNPFADPDDTVTILDELPEEDTPPDYPPPPGSPAAG